MDIGGGACITIRSGAISKRAANPGFADHAGRVSRRNDLLSRHRL
jgi:hypothetical protein